MAKAASGSNQKSKDNQPNKYRPNFWGMWQNILIAALQKGQFLIGLSGLIIIVSLLKMKPEDIANIYKELFGILKSFYLVGWLLTLLVVILWYIFAKKASKIHAGQINKLLDDYQKLQEKLINKS